ncbi:MAG: hypothetical protein ACRCZF_22415, partial [Gemmataceae bacterium]
MRTILVIAEHLPVAALGPYGNEWIATPECDRLAADGIVYDRHYANKPAAGWPVRASTVPRYLLWCGRDPAPEQYYAGAAEVFTAGTARTETLRKVLQTLAAQPDWLLEIAFDDLTPPWDVPRDVYEVYIEDLLEDDTTGELPEPWAAPPVGPFDEEDEASWELLHRSFAAVVTTWDAQVGRVRQT